MQSTAIIIPNKNMHVLQRSMHACCCSNSLTTHAYCLPIIKGKSHIVLQQLIEIKENNSGNFMHGQGFSQVPYAMAFPIFLEFFLAQANRNLSQRIGTMAMLWNFEFKKCNVHFGVSQCYPMYFWGCLTKLEVSELFWFFTLYHKC